MRTALIIAISVLLPFPAADIRLQAQAPDPPITIPNSAVHSFHSAINNTDYQLFVILPRNYASSDKRYPVFYLLDGNDTATIAWLTRSRQHSDMPEIIFVGIGYPEPLAGPPVPLPGKPAVAPAQRSADYALYNTTEPWSPPKDKGAPIFLRVIEREIIPYVDGHYRTDPPDRGLGGHSLGGLFTTYALFHCDGVFTKFWIGSPSLRWDNSVLFKDEAQYAATHKDLDARVIADVGGQESKTFMGAPLLALADQVKSHNYPHLSWLTLVLENEDHGTLPIAGMPQVINFLYGPASVTLTPSQRSDIAGNWRLPDGKLVHFEFEGDSLFATGLPFLSNTDPTKEQWITPLGNHHFELRTMLNIQEQLGASGKKQLVIGKMRSADKVIAERP